MWGRFFRIPSPKLPTPISTIIKKNKNKRLRNLLTTSLVSVLAIISGAGGLLYFDEGLRRSAMFWSRAYPIYLHYRYVQWSTKNKSDEEISEAFSILHSKYAPEVERLTLHLRGFYLKQAQMMSTLDDFVPPQYMAWCKKTQGELPTTFAPGQARQVVEKALGKPIEEIFAYWSEEPTGVASIGQVHYAILKDGREVAVKIKLPGIEKKFRTDLKTIKAFAKLAMPQHVPPLEEIEKQFLTEFNYKQEAKNLQEIYSNINPIFGKKVAIPKPIHDLCKEDLLVMEYLHGMKLEDGIRRIYRIWADVLGISLDTLDAQHTLSFHSGQLTPLPYEKMRINLLRFAIRTYDYFSNSLNFLYNYSLGLIFKKKVIKWSELPLNLAEMIELLHQVHGHQIFVDGAFNGDPHPGNFLLMNDGRIGLIDYGQVKHIDLKTRLNYAKLILALAEDDKDKIVNIFTNEMCMRGKNGKENIAYKLACFWNDRITKDILGDLNIPNFLDWAQKEDPVDNVDSEYVMIARVSVFLRGMGNAFGLELRTSTYWKPFALELLREHGEL